jgi:hypothetical protein
MNDLRKNRRKYKRTMNWMLKHCGYGKFVIDCRGHPCRVTEVDRYTDNMWQNGCTVVSLIDGTSSGCSYMHCGLEPLSETIAKSIKEPILSQEQYDALNLPKKWAWK